MKRLLQISAILLLFSVHCKDQILPPPTNQTVYKICHSIARHEGWYVKNSLVRRLHNPGALVYAGQKHAKPSETGYARFESDFDGMIALDSDIRKKIEKGMTLRKISRKWTQGVGYLSAMVDETGFGPDEKLYAN
jgi:hypothetical protein